MISGGKIWMGSNDNGEKVCLTPKLANRHGLVAGATGTGKTVTLRVLAESFSDLGVPVFLADVKGDLASMADSGADSEDMKARISKFGLDGEGFSGKGYPVTLWDVFGERGIPLRTTISEMGPLLLSRLMELTDVQEDILTVVFKIADDRNLLMYDTRDLKAVLNYVAENGKEFEADYGKMTSQSVTAIVRAVVALESVGGEAFFSEPALNLSDWLGVDENGRGRIQILDSSSLINNPKMYSTFLLWLLSELFEKLPEVGDLEKPKMVFFFDEAHLLFNDAPKALSDKVEQVVKLIRSKGVGVYFCTQNPKDIPNGVLAQLGNRVQHAMHAYTPADQKAVKAAAEGFRVNPAFDTYETIMSLGTGEAVVSFLNEDGSPGVVEKVSILPPQSRLGALDDSRRSALINGNLLYSKYAEAVDPDSAYEFLMRMGLEAEAQAEKERVEAEEQKALEKQEALDLKEQAKEAMAAQKEKDRQQAAEAKRRTQAVKSVGNSIVGTVGREAGKAALSGMGSLGRKVGANAGASIARGLFSNLFKL